MIMKDMVIICVDMVDVIIKELIMEYSIFAVQVAEAEVLRADRAGDST